MLIPCRKLSRLRRSIGRWVVTVVALSLVTKCVLVVLGHLQLHGFGGGGSTVPQRRPCVQLLLDPVDPQIVAAEESFRVAPLRCHEAEDPWVVVADNATLHIATSAREKHGGDRITCDCTPIERGADDFTVVSGKPIRPLRDGDRIPSDFFEVRCVGADGKIYRNVHSAIARRPTEQLLFSKHKESNGKAPRRSDGKSARLQPPNIIMFGFDSVSQLSWRRNMPQSTDYFLRQLGGAVMFERHNIVGDGTPQNLLPMLTGKTEMELPEARRGFQGASTVDQHPWIWKDFERAGYVTQWGEDKQRFGTFTYRMLGFDKQPTDHYMRPFYLHTESQWYGRFAPYCLGTISRHVNLLRWVERFVEAYTDLPKFSFVFHSELSHDEFNGLHLMDGDLLAFLRRLNDTGQLDNSVVILMSDHGARYQSVRRTLQGKYEERLPFFALRLPSNFTQQHPHAMNNLRHNSKQLTTPFDIHATLVDILRLGQMRDDAGDSNDELSLSSNSGLPNKHDGDTFHDRKSESFPRAYSLLSSRIPSNRTCADAHIAPHWCTCLDWQPVESVGSHALVQRAANALVSFINDLTVKHRTLCALLTLDKVKEAGTYEVPHDLLRFENSTDFDGRQPRFTDTMTAASSQTTLYQITVRTLPGGALYEATLTFVKAGDRFSVEESDISRINIYGDQPRCISEKFPHLRPYCFCQHLFEPPATHS